VLRSHGVTDAGRVKACNQDSIAIDAELALFVVADGMGAHAAGEVASRLAVEAIVGFIQRSQATQEVSWPYGIDRTLSYDGNRLKTAIHLANRRVFRAAESHDDYTGMGTTVVAALLSPHSASVGHVGDSRLYVLRDGQLEQVTRDDTWLATVLPGDPVADMPSLARHPMRHVLTNVLGACEQTQVHLCELPLRGGERLLLSSDGLHGVVDAEAIARLLGGGGDPERAARDLVEEGLKQGSQDNISVIVISNDPSAGSGSPRSRSTGEGEGR
jgi:protein phosphatase